MAINQNTTTLGNWARVAIIGPDGSAIQVGKCFDFEHRRLEQRLNREYINGVRDKFSFPMGWSGRFSFDRLDNAVEKVFVQWDALMDATGQYGNWDIKVQLRAPNVISQGLNSNATIGGYYFFHNCACTLSEGGVLRANSVVTQTVTFESSTMDYVTSPVNTLGSVSNSTFDQGSNIGAANAT